MMSVATNSDNNNIINNITANASSSSGAGATEGGMIVSPGRSARYVGILCVCVCVECTVLRV